MCGRKTGWATDTRHCGWRDLELEALKGPPNSNRNPNQAATMTKATCAVHVVFNIKPEHVESFREAVLRQAQNSVTLEEWCHQFDVCTLPEQPQRFMLYETYDDRAAFVKHRATEHFADFNSTVTPWIESKEVSIWDIA